MAAKTVKVPSIPEGLDTSETSYTFCRNPKNLQETPKNPENPLGLDSEESSRILKNPQKPS